MPITWNQAEADKVIHQSEPFKITGATVINIDKDCNRLPSMDSFETQYLQPIVDITVYIDGCYDIYLKLFANEQLQTGTTSPGGYTFMNSLQLSKQNEQYALSGWGSSTPGFWGEGEYRYELYYEGQCVYSHSFRIERGVPFIIKGVKVENVDSNGNKLPTMDSSATQYLQPILDITVLEEGCHDIYWKLFTDDQLTTGDGSPDGYSWKDAIQMSKQYNQYYLSSWGASTPGHWGEGIYRYEFYYEGQCVYSHSFGIKNAENSFEGDDFYLFLETKYKGKDINTIRKAAEYGDAEAQVELALRYDKGNDVPQSDYESVKWITKAATQGNAEGQCLLGLCYNEGCVVQQDENIAFKWFYKSAGQGNAFGQLMLYFYFYQGIGTHEDEAEAFKWLTMAAEQKLSIAQYYLGDYYENVKGNIHQAIQWYGWAAAQEYAEAQFALGQCYFNGNGVQANRAYAVDLIKKAANQGLEDAIHFLKENNL